MSIDPLSGGTNSYVQQLMALERRQLDRLEANRSSLESRKSVFTDLSSKLSALRTLVDKFAGGRQTSPVYSYSARSTDDERISVAAGSGADVGSFNVAATGVAHRHVIGSDAFDLSASSFDDKTYSFGITVDGEETVMEVTVDEDQTNESVLDAVAAAINSSGAAVTARVVNSGSGEGTLVLRSAETGLEHLISEVRDLSGKLMKDLDLKGTSTPGNFSDNTTQAASDAVIEIDGLEIQSSSNTFENAIPGVTLTVHGETEVGVDVTVSIDANEEGIKKAVEEFISTYNAALAEVRKQSTGDLRGQPLLQRLMLDLRQAVVQRVSSIPAGEVSTLAEIGVAINRDGSLAFTNPNKLEEVLANGVDEVGQLFGDASGIASRIDGFIDNFLAGSGPLSLLRRQNDDRIKRLDVRILREESRLAFREDVIRRDLARVQEFISAISTQQQLTQQFLASSFTGRGGSFF